MRACLALIGVLSAAGPLAAQVRPSAPDSVHVVRPGDTMWDLARFYLGDSFLWPEIFRLNTGSVQDPALIYPSLRLRLPGGAEPQRLTQRPRQSSSLEGSVRPGDFNRAPLLSADAEVRAAGRLAEVESPSVVPAALGSQIFPYSRVFVALAAGSAVRVGDQLQFFRRTREVRPWGWVFQSTGTASVASVQGATATVIVERMYDKIAVGDLAVPLDDTASTGGQRAGASVPAGAAIVAFAEAHPLQTPQEIVFLNVGAGSGVQVGDEFMVYIPQQQREWGLRPEVEVGRLQVVRVAERTASARIVNLEQPALEPGLPVRAVGRAP